MGSLETIVYSVQCTVQTVPLGQTYNNMSGAAPALPGPVHVQAATLRLEVLVLVAANVNGHGGAAAAGHVRGVDGTGSSDGQGNGNGGGGGAGLLGAKSDAAGLDRLWTVDVMGALKVVAAVLKAKGALPLL